MYSTEKLSLSQYFHSLVGQLRDDIETKEGEIERLRKTVEDQSKELEIINEELGTAKEANSRAPTTTMKNMVERLKNQLALKEKQHQVCTTVKSCEKKL